ncbi:MAG: ATP-dependent DNA helicase RecG [Oscillospiraceae bacterium]|nr:ATP-dependent DNA helicase RecG [Oscillospiraceae bacterium]
MLDTDIRYSKGIGEKRAALYAKLGIATVGGLLYHLPRGYIDLSAPYGVLDAPIDENCAVKARLMRKSPEQRIRDGLSVFKLRAEDPSGVLNITMFNSKYTVDHLDLDREYIFYGRVSGGFTGREMNSPAIYPINGTERIVPIYPTTAGLSSNMIRFHIKSALAALPELPDPIPADIREKYALMGRKESLRNVHFPEDLQQAVCARERFVFEELLTLCCGLSILRAGSKIRRAAVIAPVDMRPFYGCLPFAPTNAQLRAIADIIGDLGGGLPMNRLIQGDVGSGKTLVAAAAIYCCFKNGRQSALMAPTEILAEQHFATLSEFLEPLGVRVGLLTGSVKAAEKRRVKDAIASGEIDLAIGTHALLSQGVEFPRLALAVTDEQHRFGVNQRAKLSAQGLSPEIPDDSRDVHVMVMSATPIPRTLSLIVYGDLQLSVIDELPPGRKSIDTFAVGGDKRKRALAFVRKALDEGRQAYIICPLIEKGETDTGLRPAKEYAQLLSKTELKGYKISLLHGKMKAAEKEEVMRAFSQGQLQALVSTTVVEVGVDVPNATIILIENAERFGLSQLHQLRGRVGRGTEKSYCILISDSKGETAKGRLDMMKRTGDGFALAEYDLKARGPGDFFGQRQHGLPELKIASLSDNLDTMKKAKQCADEILIEDPQLCSPKYTMLGEMVRELMGRVGTSPN